MIRDSFPFACTCFAKDHTNWPRLYFTARHDLSACVFLCSFGFVFFFWTTQCQGKVAGFCTRP